MDGRRALYHTDSSLRSIDGGIRAGRVLAGNSIVSLNGVEMPMV